MQKAFLLGAALLAVTGHAQSATASPVQPSAPSATQAATPAAQVASGNVAAPLGLELGKTRCARISPSANHEKAGKAQWAGGDAIEIRSLDRFNLPGLTRVIVNCDAQDTVALITMTFDRTALDDVSKKLDARYESKRKTDANAENAYAEWAATNGSLELLYARDGKQFTVAYWAKGAKAKYFGYGGAGKPAAASAPAPAPVKQAAPL